MTENKNLIETQRQKLDTDLNLDWFVHSWFLQNNKAKAVGIRYRIKLFKEFRSSHLDLFTKVSSGSHSLLVLPREHIEALKDWLYQEKGMTVSKIIVKKTKEGAPKPRQKLATDLGAVQVRNWKLRDQNGNFLHDPALQSLFFREFKYLNPNLFIKVFVNKHLSNVLPQEHIPAFQEWLKEEKKITVFKTKIEKQRQILETDLIATQFHLNWVLKDENNNVIPSSRKLAFFSEFRSLHPDLFVQVFSGRKSVSVLPQENIPYFQNWLKTERGITASKTEIADKQRKDFKKKPKETKTISCRQICDTDIIKAQFLLYFGFTTLKGAPALINNIKKAKIWKELEKQEDPNLLVPVFSGDYQTYVLPKENIPYLKQWLYKEKGILLSVPNEQDGPQNPLLLNNDNAKGGR